MHGRPCASHDAQFCMHPGGVMQKAGFSAVCDAARATAREKTKTAGSNTNKQFVQLTEPSSKVYLMEKAELQKLQTLSTAANPQPASSAFAGLVTDELSTKTLDNAEWEGWMATVEKEEKPEELKTTLDWKQYSNNSALTATTNQPFFVDSGTTVYISPCKSDFLTLQPIAPKAIRGVGGSSISAHGIGSIRLCTGEGTILALEKALYVPNSSVHLISVSRISVDHQTHSCFDEKEVRIISNVAKTVIARGPLLKGKGLYTINLSSDNIEHAYTSVDMETWHRQLGHTNYQAIQQLAHNQMIKGASPSPYPLPKCDSCILKKQTHTPIPKIWQEGHRATEKLRIVWADPFGPVSVRSRSGNYYILDIVDDCTNMPWSILLKNKKDAFLALKTWEIA